MVSIKPIIAALALTLCGSAMAFDLNLNSLGEILQGGGGSGSSGVDIGQVADSLSKTQSLSLEDEAILGDEAAAVLLGAIPLVDDRDLQRYVNRVGLWLALQSERPNLPWHFGVLDTEKVNSFAAPYGYVFITRGLLENLRSESELAGVLAHEIVHVVERHYINAVQKNAQLDLGLTLAAALTKTDRRAMDLVTNSCRQLYARGLDKDDEYEADAKALVLTARAGYEPFGLPAVLQTLAAKRPDDSTLSYMLATHPSPNDRLSHIENATGVIERYADQPLLADRFLGAGRR